MDDYDLIETPENVELERRLAGIGTRLIAGLIDNLIIGLSLLVIILLWIGVSGVSSMSGMRQFVDVHAWFLAYFMIAIFLLYTGYFFFFELFTDGSTPGKKKMGIRVVEVEGRGVGFQSIAVRSLLRLVDGIGAYAVAGITMFLGNRLQRLGDMAAGTVVIRERFNTNYSSTYDEKGDLLLDDDMDQGVLSEIGLEEEEYRLINSYWSRRSELEPLVRGKLLKSLMVPIIQRHDLDIPNHTNERLEELLRDYMRKARNARKARNIEGE